MTCAGTVNRQIRLYNPLSLVHLEFLAKLKDHLHHRTGMVRSFYSYQEN